MLPTKNSFHVNKQSQLTLDRQMDITPSNKRTFVRITMATQAAVTAADDDNDEKEEREDCNDEHNQPPPVIFLVLLL